MRLGSHGVQLKEVTKCKLKLQKCTLRHKVKHNRGDIKLTSTEIGKKTLVECSKVIKNGLLSGIKDEAQIKCHVNSWYPN